MSVDVGQMAPEFSLKNQHGEVITLDALRGRPAIVVFFPFAFSGLCTGELSEIRDNSDVFTAAEVRVVAVSCDPVFSNRAFSDSQNLPFDVLSDFWPHGAAARSYGIFNEEIGAAERGSYLLDSTGVVRWKIEHPRGQVRDLQAYRAAIAELG